MAIDYINDLEPGYSVRAKLNALIDEANAPSVSSHNDLTNVTPDQHHSKEHQHNGSDGSGLITHDNIQGVTADQHHNQVHKLYGPDHDDVDDSDPLLLRDVLEFNGSTWSTGRRTRFIPNGFVNGQEYQIGDEVANGSQISECIVDGATEQPFIEPTGSPFYAYNGTMGTRQDLAKQVLFGNRYSVNVAGYFSGYRLNAIAGNSYRVYLVLDPLGDRIYHELIDFTATQTDWLALTIPTVALSADTTFDLIVYTQEPDPTPTVWFGQWDYTTPNNENIPGAGVISQANRLPTELRVNKTDADGGDRSTELEALTQGDTISANGVTWTIQSVVDNGNQIFFTVSPGTQATPDGETQFSFQTVSATPIDSGEDINYWALNPPVDGTIQGLFGADTAYSDLVPNDNAYGVDVLVQRAYIPTEWAVKVLAEGGSGGGGSFIPTIFAGAGTTGYVPDPGTEQNYYLRDDGTWQPVAGGGGQVDSVVSGTAITVDATDPVNPIVNSNLFEGTGAPGHVPDPGSELNYFLRDDGTFQPPPVSPIGGTFLNMTFDSDTDTSTEPSSGDLRLNDAGDHLNATELATSETTRPGNNAQIIWEQVFTGDYIGLWETGGDHEGVTYIVTGPPVDNGTWWQIPIQAVGGQDPAETDIDNNRAIQVFFIANPARALPPGGTTGQVLTKATNADYDDYWADPAAGGAGHWTLNGDDIHNNNIGSVGIGTDTPTNLLHVAGTNYGGTARISDDVGATLNLANVDGSSRWGMQHDIASSDWRLTYNGSDKMRVSSDGNVGIGTSDPDVLLTVGGIIRSKSDASEYPRVSLWRTGDALSGEQLGSFNFAGEVAGSAVSLGSIRGFASDNWAAGYNPGYIVFRGPNGTGSEVERMRINEDGTIQGLVSGSQVIDNQTFLKVVTQAEYDGLTPDPNTIYFIVG